MRNDTCIICGTKFEPREKKMYCSESCKQKAYNDRKKESNKENTLEQTESMSPEVKQSILYTFYLKEYEKVKRKAEKSKSQAASLDFIEYCFFRKNLTGKIDIDFILEYINQFDVDELYDERFIMKKKYTEFQETFHTRTEIVNEIPEYLLENNTEKPKKN